MLKRRVDGYKHFCQIHCDNHVGTEQCHLDLTVFQEPSTKALNYTIVSNATHVMQPMDKCVFEPLKSKWHIAVRKFSRETLGKSINKEIFAEKLTYAFLLFYKPLTVIHLLSRSSGIYPLDSSAISNDALKPGLTFASEVCTKTEDCTRNKSNKEPKIAVRC